MICHAIPFNANVPSPRTRRLLMKFQIKEKGEGKRLWKRHKLKNLV